MQLEKLLGETTFSSKQAPSKPLPQTKNSWTTCTKHRKTVPTSGHTNSHTWQFLSINFQGRRLSRMSQSRPTPPTLTSGHDDISNPIRNDSSRSAVCTMMTTTTTTSVDDICRLSGQRRRRRRNPILRFIIVIVKDHVRRSSFLARVASTGDWRRWRSMLLARYACGSWTCQNLIYFFTLSLFSC